MSRYTMGRSVSSSLPLVSQCSVTSVTSCATPSSLSSLTPLSASHSTQYRCEELRVRIHENHLSYLNRDETPAKLEMRNKIECLIAEYLFLVPHSQKFSFIEVSNCLNRSIIENSEFSAYKAANAFEALEKYATNLITLPWRKEYQSICPYSGFYRHVIQKMLIGAEHILMLMGFVHNSSKGIYQLNDCPIDADKLSRVSLECLVAFVECQIMIQIREALKAKGYSNCSWREIHAIRVEYVCGQADAIKLICEKRKTAKLIDYENTNSNNTPKRIILSETVDSGQHRNGYSLIDGYLSPQKQFAHIYDEDDDSPESFDLLNYPIVDTHSFPVTQQQCQYCLPHSNSLPPCPPPPFTYLTPQPMFASFPTPQITHKLQTASKGIQAEMPPLSNGIGSTLSKMSLHSGNNNKKAGNESNGLTSNNNSSQTRKDSSQSSNKSNRRGSFYDNLDPINFLETSLDTNLNSCDKKAIERKSPPQERNKQSASSLEKKKPLEKKKSLDCNSISRIVSSIKPSSSASKTITSSSYNSISNNSINSSESKSLPPVSNVSTNTQLSSLSTLSSNLANEKIKPEESQRELKSAGSNKQNDFEKWSCISCTFLNKNCREVCEMCHRSRKSGNEAMPLVSGGRECSRCTLVNDKEEKFCRACDTSLADSPTYI